jgi:hypothetical protein
MARLLSVNVGLPRDIVWKGRIVRTAIDVPHGNRVFVMLVMSYFDALAILCSKCPVS